MPAAPRACAHCGLHGERISTWVRRARGSVRDSDGDDAYSGRLRPRTTRRRRDGSRAGDTSPQDNETVGRGRAASLVSPRSGHAEPGTRSRCAARTTSWTANTETQRVRVTNEWHRSTSRRSRSKQPCVAEMSVAEAWAWARRFTERRARVSGQDVRGDTMSGRRLPLMAWHAVRQRGTSSQRLGIATRQSTCRGPSPVRTIDATHDASLARPCRRYRYGAGPRLRHPQDDARRARGAGLRVEEDRTHPLEGARTRARWPIPSVSTRDRSTRALSIDRVCRRINRPTPDMLKPFSG